MCELWSDGLLPFSDCATLQEVADIVRKGGSCPIPNNFPRKIKEIIANCFSRSPKLRPIMRTIAFQLVEHAKPELIVPVTGKEKSSQDSVGTYGTYGATSYGTYSPSTEEGDYASTVGLYQYISELNPRHSSRTSRSEVSLVDTSEDNGESVGEYE